MDVGMYKRKEFCYYGKISNEMGLKIQ